jgi:hypothetical protein
MDMSHSNFICVIIVRQHLINGIGVKPVLVQLFSLKRSDLPYAKQILTLRAYMFLDAG